MKFRFTIRTRDGSIVENLTIPGNDQAEAETRLRQIYRGCTVVQARALSEAGTPIASELEDVITLIAAEARKPPKDDPPG